MYKARDEVNGRIVALKVLAAATEMRVAPGANEALARSEFRLLASLTHPGLVRVLDYGHTDQGLSYFSMELLEGQDLCTFHRGLGTGARESDVFTDVMVQALDALEHLHRRGVLHLDLKPSNILVTRDDPGCPVAKLIDFGLAARPGMGSNEASGTVEYLAPERLGGETPDARSDLYSLGATLFEVFTGTPPHVGATTSEVVADALEGPVRDVSRVPSRWRSIVARLLERDRSRRFGSARAVLFELLGPETASSFDFPPFEVAFVGREELLLELLSAARAAAPGSPRAVLLRGPPGVGKTRLLRELLVQLQLEGITAGIETCSGNAAKPGDLLLGLLRHAAQGADSRVAAIETETVSLRSEGPSGLRDATEAEARRDRLLRKTTEKLLEFTLEKPVALIVDDLQLADSLSRDGLVQLLRASTLENESRLIVILAADDEPSETVDGLERATKSLGILRTSRLGGLEARDVHRYLAEVFGENAIPEETGAVLARETGGNVHFLEEYLRLLVKSGRLRRLGASWELGDGERLEVPRTVGEAIQQRLAKLSPGMHHCLEWVSVLDRPMFPSELATFLDAGTTPSNLDRQLAALAREQILKREGQRYTFAHSAARSVVHAMIPEEARRAMHAVVALRLLSEPDRSEEIAHHLYLSGDLRRAKDHLRRAGERARRTGSLREANLHYSRALEAEDVPRNRFELLLSRQEILGLLGRKDAQREDIAALKAIATALGEAKLEREAALEEALYLESLGRKREALEQLQEALKKCHDDRVTEAKLLTRSAMLEFYLSEFDAGFSVLTRALEVARALKDRSLEAECLQVRGLGHYLRLNLDEAVEEMSRALSIRKEEGDETKAASLESNLGLIHFDRGDLEAAEERFLASHKLFQRVGLRRGEAVNLLNLALVYLEMGRHERALDAFLGSLRHRKELGDRRGEGADLGNLGAAWIQVGRHERAVPLLEDAIRIARECENRQSESANECRLAQVALERGESEKALLRFERALEISHSARIAAQEIQALTGLSSAALALGDAGRAEKLAREALVLAEARKMRRRPALIRSLLAMACLEAEKLEEADRESLKAVEIVERFRGSWGDAHLVWFHRYRVLQAVASEGAGEEALRRAYGLLRERSDAFQDEELRQSYLESIVAHREINRLHEVLQARNRREATRRERSFHEIARSLHSITEIDPLLDRLLELAIETTHGEKGLITLRQADGEFTIRAARGMARESVDDASDICKSVIADIEMGGEPVLAVDAGSDERFRERRSIVSFRIRTLMCVPMKASQEVLGAVYVDGRGASSFNREDLEYLVSFAQLAAIAVENARLMDCLRAENLSLRREVETQYRFENLIGKSPAMMRLTLLMEKVANTPACVLISGETGTGKEVIARSIHHASRQRGKPFVAVDCGALPANLLESELFGHRRGAFSGAIHDRAGLFEEAEGGTLFLDEITNTSLDLQAKLLRVLQEGEIRRVGENHMRKVEVRIIAATNTDLRGAVERGTFREDLYYRLNVISIEVPPLRERREDVPILAQHFLRRSCDRLGKRLLGFTVEAMESLAAAPWRGNVRELENLIERAVILAEEERIDARFLETLLPRGAKPSVDEQPQLETASPGHDVPREARMAPSLEAFDLQWHESECRYLQALVDESGGNLAEAARRAGVRNRNTLISRLNRHGIRGKRGQERG